MGDLGEAVGGEDGNGEGKAVVGVVVRFGDRGGEALAELNEAGKAENAEVASGVVVECKKLIDWDFLKIFIHSPNGTMPFLGRVLILASFGYANVCSFLAKMMY